MITEYDNSLGVKCVMWEDETGFHSMTQEAYDAQQVAKSTK
jgi:hypothetical protein